MSAPPPGLSGRAPPRPLPSKGAPRPPPGGLNKPPAGLSKPPAGLGKPPAGLSRPPAGLSKPPAGLGKPPSTPGTVPSGVPDVAPVSGRGKKLSKEQIEETKECFALFDEDNDGFVEVDKISILMMSLGHNPTRKELQKILLSTKTKRRGYVSLSEFMLILKGDLRKTSSGDEILEGFKVYDSMMSRNPGNGRVSTKELRHVMTTFGERLNEEEVEGMLRFAADYTKGGQIDYENFVEKIVNPHKRR